MDPLDGEEVQLRARRASTGRESEAAMQRSRLKKDLSVVYEKIRLCRELLFDSQGAAHDQPLAELVGFLEACEPLLRGLIEVGSKSLPASHDPILAEVFRLHAALLATLHAEKASPAHQLSYPLLV